MRSRRSKRLAARFCAYSAAVTPSPSSCAQGQRDHHVRDRSCDCGEASHIGYPVWPKNWHGGRTCTSQGDRACRRPRVGTMGSKLPSSTSPTSSISYGQKTETAEKFAVNHVRV